MACTHNWTVTSECPKCLRTTLDTITAMSHEDWDDRTLPEDEAIKAAHPTRTGQHERYAEAMRLVGAKRSKYALVELVNWLLSRIPEGQ